MIVRFTSMLLGGSIGSACGGPVTPVDHRPDGVHDVHGVLSNNVVDVEVDGTGAVWAVTNMGVTRYDPATQRARMYTVHDALPSPYVSRVSIDHAGTAWLSTARGVVRTRSDGRLDGVLEETEGRSDHIVGHDGSHVWAAVRARGLYRVDGTEHPELRLGSEAFPQGTRRYSDLVVLEDGSFWLGTFTGGLWHYSASRERGAWVSEVGQLAVPALVIDGEGALWIPTQGRGLWRLRPGEPAPVRVLGAELPDELWDVAVASDGTMWVASEWDGLYRVDADLEHASPWSGSSAIPVPDILSLAVRGTDLWVGHAAGVSRIDTRTGGAVAVLMPIQGLAGTVSDLQSTSSGLLLGTSGGGVVKAVPAGMSGRGRKHGVASNLVSAVAIRVSPSGHADRWAATLFGLSAEVPGRHQYERVDLGAASDHHQRAVHIPAAQPLVWSATRDQVFRIDPERLSGTPLLRGCQLPSLPRSLATSQSQLLVGLLSVNQGLLQIDPDHPCDWVAHPVGGPVYDVLVDDRLGAVVAAESGLWTVPLDGSPPVRHDARRTFAVDLDVDDMALWAVGAHGLSRLDRHGDVRSIPAAGGPASDVAWTPQGVFLSRPHRVDWVYDPLAVTPIVTEVPYNAFVPRVAAMVDDHRVVQARPGGVSVSHVRAPHDGTAVRFLGHVVTALARGPDHSILVGTALSGLWTVGSDGTASLTYLDHFTSVRSVVTDEADGIWVATGKGLVVLSGDRPRVLEGAPVADRLLHTSQGVLALSRSESAPTLSLWSSDGTPRREARVPMERVDALATHADTVWLAAGTEVWSVDLPTLTLHRHVGPWPADAGPVVDLVWSNQTLWGLIGGETPAVVAWRPHPLDRRSGPISYVPLDGCAAHSDQLVVAAEEVVALAPCGSTAVAARPPPWRARDWLPTAFLGVLALAVPGGFLAHRRRPALAPLRALVTSPSRVHDLALADIVPTLRGLRRAGLLGALLRRLELPRNRRRLVRTLLSSGPIGPRHLHALRRLLEAPEASAIRRDHAIVARWEVPRPRHRPMVLDVIVPDVGSLAGESPGVRSQTLREAVSALDATPGPHTIRVMWVHRADRGRGLWDDPTCSVLGDRALGSLLVSPDPRASLAGWLLRQGNAPELSPYVTTGAVKSPEMFFGRAQVIRRLTAHGLPNAFLVGPRRVGKSSLLARLDEVLQAQSIKTLRLQLQGVSELSDVVTLLTRAGGPARDGLEDLLVAWTATGPGVLLLDEADGLVTSPHGPGILALLRRLSADGRLGMVMTGYRELYETTLDREGAGHNFAEVVQLGPLDEAAAMNLAIEPMARVGVHWVDESDARALVRGAGGYPYLVQLLCDEILCQLSPDDEPRLVRAHVAAAGTCRRVRDELVHYVYRNTPPLTRWLCLRFVTEVVIEEDAAIRAIGEELGLDDPAARLAAAVRPLVLFGYLRSEGRAGWTWCSPLVRQLLRDDPGRARVLHGLRETLSP